MSTDKLALEWIPGAFAICHLPVTADIPVWATTGRPDQMLVSATRTDRELSIIAPQEAVPEGVQAERGWVAMRVAGQLDMLSVGILARLSGALAGAEVPVFTISTYDTDVMLVKSPDVGRALEALAAVADVSRM
ncbi:MAG: ACT domain-containing protein [Planctomycetota bacterium]|jgi:hypothetical protein